MSKFPRILVMALSSLSLMVSIFYAFAGNVLPQAITKNGVRSNAVPVSQSSILPVTDKPVYKSQVDLTNILLLNFSHQTAASGQAESKNNAVISATLSGAATNSFTNSTSVGQLLQTLTPAAYTSATRVSLGTSDSQSAVSGAVVVAHNGRAGSATSGDTSNDNLIVQNVAQATVSQGNQ